MSEIFIIAGPPGIGKSSNGADYIDPNFDILNEDDTKLKYKDKGFPDYNEYALTRVRNIIRHKLIRNEDFALELNLGFAHQYEYALSVKSSARKISLISFFFIPTHCSSALTEPESVISVDCIWLGLKLYGKCSITQYLC